MASQSGMTSSGPFTAMGVQLFLRFGRIGLFVLTDSPASRQPAHAAGHQARYPASYARRPAEEPVVLSRFPVAFRLPAFASWASCPVEEFGPSYDRLTGPHRRIGPRRGFHVPHA